MFLHSALLERFKNILHLEFKAEGNHVVITGPNGAGKTTILEALLVLLFGKKVLPDDPIMHGHESSAIECGICDEKGGKVQYKIKAKFTDKTFGLEVSTFLANGTEFTVKKPTEFLSQLVTRDFIDPEEFCSKKGADRIAMLYKLLPGLQKSIDDLQKEYEAEQFKRSQINQDKIRINAELINNPFTPDLPDVEIDAANLVDELSRANMHNLSKVGIENAIAATEKDVSVTSEMMVAASENIEAFEKKIEDLKAQRDQLSKNLVAFNQKVVVLSEQLSSFVPIDVSEINARIASMGETNKAIRKNQKNAELKKQLADKEAEFSQGLVRMREIEEKKVQVYRDAKMPVEGLAVGEKDITFPDPNTGEVVAFGSLSTGQKYRVGIGILSAFLPPAEKGMRCMVIQDANAMDPNNYEKALEAATAAEIQLILHKTSQVKEQNKLEILIEGND